MTDRIFPSADELRAQDPNWQVNMAKAAQMIGDHLGINWTFITGILEWQVGRQLIHPKKTEGSKRMLGPEDMVTAVRCAEALHSLNKLGKDITPTTSKRLMELIGRPGEERPTL